MLKVAIAADTQQKIKTVEQLLATHYTFESIEEEQRNELFTVVIQLKDDQGDEIEEMFQLLYTVTGIDPRERHKHSKKQSSMKANRAASFLLRYRFRFSYIAIAQVLNYVSHVSPLHQCRAVQKVLFPKAVARDTVSIELAIRRVLNLNREGPRKAV